MTMPTIESGLQTHRVEFIRETTAGTTPTNPAWLLFSDLVTRVEWTPNAAMNALRGIGDVDPADHKTGPEAHPLAIRYYLQRWFSASGDAGYDGLARDSDNRLPATHSVIVRRLETTGGDDSSGYRTYIVGQGGHVGQVAVTGDPSAAEHIPVTLQYQFEKVRSYEIHQPSAADSLTVESTSASDTTQVLTIETDGADKTETVTLTGTTAATTTNSFSDIDVLSLSSETIGNVLVKRKTGGTQLAIIYGSKQYNNVEGDLGIPPLGSGSHGSAVGTSYEQFLDDTVQRPGGTDLAYDINNVEVTVNNNLATTPRLGSLKQRIHTGVRDAKMSATVVGLAETHDKIMEHLRTAKNNLVWTFTGGTLQLDNAVIMDPGGRVVEAGQAFVQPSVTFEGEGVTIG